MSRKILISAVVVAAVAGGVYWSGLLTTAPAPAAGPQGALPAAALKIELQTIQRSHELPGRLTATTMGEIRPQVSGIITKRLFEEGSNVEKGQQLYQIDPASYQAAYNSAAAELNRAQATVTSVQARAERYAKLIKANAVSQQEYDDTTAELAEAKADVAVAQAALATAEVNLNYTKVYAPVSGAIGRSYVTEGALVTANQSTPLAVITQLDPVYVDMTLPAEDLLPLRQALGTQAASVTLVLPDDKSGASLPEGTLLFSEVTVDETTGTTALRAAFPNPDHVLLPGMFVRAKIALPAKQGLLVPQQSTQRQPDGTLVVWAIQDGKIAVQPIQATETVGSNWLVSGGLEPGAAIVASGFQKLKPGTPVDPKFAEKPAQPKEQ